MKRLYTIFLLIGSLLLLNSCDEDNMISQNPEERNLGTITGKISNWSSTNNKIVVFGYGDNIIFGVSKVNDGGEFNIKPTEPSDKCLHSISLFPTGGICNNSLNFSNPDAKAVIGSFSVFTPGEQGVVGFVYRLNVPLKDTISQIGGFFSVQFIYVDRDVKITGKDQCFYDYNDNGEIFSITQEVNLDLKLGWNKIVYRSKLENEHYSVIEVTNLEPDGGEWIYDSI